MRLYTVKLVLSVAANRRAARCDAANYAAGGKCRGSRCEPLLAIERALAHTDTVHATYSSARFARSAVSHSATYFVGRFFGSFAFDGDEI